MDQDGTPRLVLRLPQPTHSDPNTMMASTQEDATISKKWTASDVALLINYADECLRNGENYKHTIRTRLLDHAGRARTYAAVESKLNHILKTYNQPVHAAGLIEKGTKGLHIRAFPEDVVKELKAQRLKWNLADLEVENSAFSHDDTTGEEGARINNQTTHRETRPGTMKRASRERTVLDSESSEYSPESEDTRSLDSSDLVEIRPVERPAVTAPVKRACSSCRQLKVKCIGEGSAPCENCVSAGLACTYTAKSQEKRSKGSRATSLPKSEQAVAARRPPSRAQSEAAAHKRKASSGEMIDVDDDIPPPPKRQVLESTTAAAVKTSKPSAVPPHLHARDSCSVPPQAPPTDALQKHMPVQPSASPTIRNVALTAPSQALSKTPQSQAVSEGVQGQLDDLRFGFYSLMQERMESDKPLTPDMKESLMSMKKSMLQEPGNLAHRLLSSLNAKDAAYSKLFDQFKAILGRPCAGKRSTFPPVPTKREVDPGWSAIRDGIKDAFTNDLDYIVTGEQLSIMSATYITCTIDGLLADPQIRRGLIPSLAAHLKSGFAARSLMSALFCCWLFAVPDSMCDGKHNDVLMKQYEARALSDGLSEVQRDDKIGFSSLFADANFQKTGLQSAAADLLRRFSVIDKVCPSAPGLKGIKKSEEWAKAALELKQRLMISPKDYRVHFCLPTTPFNPAWMTAEDGEGDAVPAEQAKTRKIFICLFPALVEQDAEPFGEKASIEDALVKNKKFFPSWQEKQSLDPKTVISKAVVLVGPGQTAEHRPDSSRQKRD